MTALSIQVPFPVFQDRDGQPLDNGYVWLGTSSLNPQTNPVVAYYDSALTIVATQPLRTLNGFISRAGSPAQVYVDAVNFSILVQDRQGTTVFSVPEGTGISPNASGVVYDPAGTGAVATTVQEKLRERVSVKDFGAVGDGVTDDTAAIQAALNSGALAVYIPTGSYLTGSLTVPITVQKVYGEGELLANANGVTVLKWLADTSRQNTKTTSGLRISGNSKTGVIGIQFGSVTNNPSAGAQEATLYASMRDVIVRLCETGINSVVSMEHHYDNVVCISNTVGMKLYSDAVNGGCNANTFTAMRFQSNTVGTMVVSNSNFPVHNNIFDGCIWQSNTVCGLYVKGFSSSGAVAGMVVKGFHVESNGTGAATATIDGFTVSKSDFHFNRASVALEDADLSTSVTPCVLAENYSRVAPRNITGYGNTVGIVYSPDATSQINESGLCVSNGVKYVETYGQFNSMGNLAVIGSPKMSLGFHRNNSTMANPAIPLLDNTTGATVSTTKNANLGLMSSIQFAASAGSTTTNRNYWNNGNGTAGDYFLFSVICMTNANTTIRFYTLQTGAYKQFDVAFVANVPKRIIVGGVLSGTQGLQVYTWPTDSVGAMLSFKAHEYVLTTDLSVINDVYQNGLCGVKTLNYEALPTIPTFGTWKRGEVVWNSEPSTLGQPGWIVVTAGTYGGALTFKAMAILSA